MGILQLPIALPSQTGLVPATKKMVTTDTLATITTAGYLNQYDLQGNPIATTDAIEVIYLFNQQTNSGTYGLFLPSISNGIITLVEWTNPGDVLKPVVSGDFAVFNGTSGQIKDSGLAPSSTTSQLYAITSPGSLTTGNFPTLNDANGTLNTGLPPSASGQAFVVVSPGGFTTNHIAQIADANGTLKDGGILGTAAGKAASDNTKLNVASVALPTVNGNLALFKDTAGTVGDSGVYPIANRATGAGGSTTLSITDSNILIGSPITANFVTQQNASNILTVNPSNGSMTIVCSADPGSWTISYVGMSATIN